VTLMIVVGMCVLAFSSGWLLSRLFQIELPQQVSLMFGLGMNNNGTGLVLATVALSHFPKVMLPIIFYNLVQHIVAGSVDFLMFRRADSDRPRVVGGAMRPRHAEGYADAALTASPSESAPRAEG
jgi:BASS family bile acid:Na+ symporter